MLHIAHSWEICFSNKTPEEVEYQYSVGALEYTLLDCKLQFVAEASNVGSGVSCWLLAGFRKGIILVLHLFREELVSRAQNFQGLV